MSIGQHNHQLQQRLCPLEDELEEHKLTAIPSELVKHHRGDAVDAPNLLPGLEIELASRLVSLARLQNQHNLTRICNVSTLGKHLRKVGSILASLRIPNLTFKAKILTLGTMFDGIIFPHLNYCAPNLELVDAWLQVAEHLELSGVANPEPCAEASRAGGHARQAPLTQDYALEERGDDHVELNRQGMPEDQALEAAAADPEAAGGVEAGYEGELLEHGAAGEQVVDVPGVDGGEAEPNLAEAREHGGAAREAGGVREPPEAEVEGAERGDAEDVVGEAHAEGEGAVDEDEVLGSPVGEEAEPVLEAAVARERLYVRRRKRTGPRWERMARETASVVESQSMSVRAGRRSTRRSESSRTSGAVAQTRRQRLESVAVRAASLAGRRDTTSRSSLSGRRLMRSSPPPPRAPLREGEAPGVVAKGAVGRQVRTMHELEECELTTVPLEVLEHHPLDVELQAADGAFFLPELGIELARSVKCNSTRDRSFQICNIQYGGTHSHCISTLICIITLINSSHLDGDVGNVEHVDPCVQVAEHLELLDVADVEPAGAEVIVETGTDALTPKDEPFKARDDEHVELFGDGHPEEHATEAAAAEANAGRRVVAGDERELLQDGAALEKAVDFRGLDVRAAEPEVEEVGEDDFAAAECFGDLGAPGELIPEAEVEAAEGGDAEDVGGEARVDGPGAADENEVVDALGREEAEPVARERAAVARRGVTWVRRTQRKGPGCAARTRETLSVMARQSVRKPEAPPSGWSGRRWASSRTSGVEAQTRRQRGESAAVRAASLAGRRETMLESSASGRRLMRSSPASPAAAREESAASNIKVPKSLQSWCSNDLDVGDIVKVHLSELGLPNHHAAQAPRPDMEVPRVVLRQHEGKGLEVGAARDHGVEVAVLRGGVDNAELVQAQESRSDAGRVRELAEADPEAAEGGAAEDVGGDAPFDGPGAIHHHEEVLDALGSEGGEHGGDGLGVLGLGGGEARGADGARVGGERRHGGGEGEPAGTVVEDERGRVPQVAPAGGEHRSAGRVLGWETGDDVAADRVGESADAVLVFAVQGGGLSGGERVREGGGGGRGGVRREVG
ncbi:LOW QUALITY PROTEIN: hypothetical protein U9M48_018570 [Paspalum notatum var. saurae]|uniref:Uncharacterized protein n=1 Tax=Paspalum notatum var. saurae TaxID=547442 RepID=A0AAQ3WQM8_PASNO